MNLTGNSSHSLFFHFETCQPSFPAVFLLITAYAIVTLVGLLGNFCLIVIIGKQKESQNVTNILIANLSVSDILICVMCIPFTAAYTLMDYWVFGEAMCKMNNFVQSMSVTVSTFSLVLIAIERYQLIVNPRGWKPKIAHAFWGIVFIWMWPSVEERQGYTTTMLVCQYFFPLGFIFICYLKIFVCLQKRYGKVDNIKENENRLNESKRINAMLISIVVTFGACWLPLNVFNIMFDWNYEALISCHHNVIFILCHLVAMISTCVNPFFYGFLNKNFQKDLVILFHNFKCFESQELYENIALSTVNTDVSKVSMKLNNMPANI
uniref:G-protein coupled receptors family 1 profile domain-containing protein n=1 Tax=Anolis carolinensis TaxID=28377 RepID=G1KW62_ANOCA